MPLEGIAARFACRCVTFSVRFFFSFHVTGEDFAPNENEPNRNCCVFFFCGVKCGGGIGVTRGGGAWQWQDSFFYGTKSRRRRSVQFGVIRDGGVCRWQ